MSKPGGRVQLIWIAVEKVGHDDQVAVRGELVGDELLVDEFMAEHVSQEEDCILGVSVFGVGEVGFGWFGEGEAGRVSSLPRLHIGGQLDSDTRTVSDHLHFTGSLPLVLDPDGAALARRM